MSIRLGATLAAFAGIFAFSGAGAAETPYYKNVSDIEVETAVKGATYDKGMVNYFSGNGSKKSDCCCVCPGGVATASTPATTSVAASAAVVTPTAATSAASTPTPAPTPSAATDAPHVKYILDGKPVYEDGAAPTTQTATPATPEAAVPAAKAPEKPKSTTMKVDTSKIQMAIAQLGTSSWKDAQALLLASGRSAVPLLIDALSSSETAYNLGGHTKADAGRAPRQLTIADVAGELLTEIINNHSNYSGDLPGADQAEWKEWWTKNSASVTFAGDVVESKTAAVSAANTATLRVQ